MKLADGRRAALNIDGLPDGVVTALARIGGALWIGSVDGAAVLRDGTWISSNRGVLRTELSTLNAVADGRGRLAIERYGEIDGMANAQAHGSSGPRMIARADGSVWVVTAGGVSMVAPTRLQRFRKRRAPPALIESVQQDGRPLAWRQQAKLAGGHRLNVS